ncbi:uncharacterized protein [Chironomus tepperi]|uniref:uncharacterized protein isoform X2 n=1 Tax=Chironomus tepperi TaxID=113505 RepID=UPI00391FA4EB
MNFGKTTSIIISGSAFLYLLAQSTKFISTRIKIERKLKSSDDSQTTSHCCICNSEKVDDTNTLFVTCKGCELLVCTKQSCSEHVIDLDIWECDRCRKNRIVQQKTGEWFLKQLKDFSAFNFEMALGENILNLQNENGNKVVISKVRELIEKCLIKILNGSDLDATSVEQISESEEYLHIFKKFHHLLTSLIFKLEKSIHVSLIYDLPNSSCINSDYVELKRFINRVCQEVINISDTLEFSDASVPKASFDPQTYEELLATAVLNKITDNFHHRKKNGMNSPLPAEKDTELAHDDDGDIDFSLYSKMHYDKIQSHKISLPDLLNEFDTMNDEDDENGNHSGSWEGNWSMKRFPTGNIAMLIPEPKFGAEKPKIGEKDIDELSDSSNKDTNSEDLDPIYEDEHEIERHMSYIDSLEDGDDEELFESILETADLKEEPESSHDDHKSVLKLENSYDIELDNEAIFNNISEIKGNIDEIFEQILSTDNDSSNEKLQNELIEQEISSENVTENDNVQNTIIESPTIEESKTKYKSPLFTQYLVEPIQPIKISEALKNATKITEVPEINNHQTVVTANITEPENIPEPLSIMKPENLNIIKPKNDLEENSPPIPGSIAEREHLKWLKAIPIENNPYSPEALQKRLSRTHDKHFDISSDKHADEVPSNYFDERQLTDDITKYKRDYYINQNSASTESINKPKNETAESDVIYAVDNSLEQQNDSSLATSDDSLTRIYTLSSQETVIIPSHKSAHESHQEQEDEELEVKKFDIAEENIPLPSVKKLAEFYASSTNLSESNSKEPEQMNIPEGISKITSMMYATTDMPAKPIASITARTLPAKIKEDLRKSLHSDDALTVIRHNERNVSPDIQHGMTRNSIAYFENFYK